LVSPAVPAMTELIVTAWSSVAMSMVGAVPVRVSVPPVSV
jgi:hypothetical protein